MEPKSNEAPPTLEQKTIQIDLVLHEEQVYKLLTYKS